VTDGLHIASASGTSLSGNINVPATGAWQTWTTVDATVTLPAGQQTLTINQDNAGWNIHELTFASSSGSGGSCGELTANQQLGANQSVARQRRHLQRVRHRAVVHRHRRKVSQNVRNTDRAYLEFALFRINALCLI
jgi:hypothetical protein